MQINVNTGIPSLRNHFTLRQGSMQALRLAILRKHVVYYVC